jgi:serine/threonine protein kinase
MLAGRAPFIQPNPNAPNSYVFLMQQHVENPPPRVTDFCGGCPEKLADLIDHLLAKSPDDRPTSSSEVVKQLQAILSDPKSDLLAQDGQPPSGEAELAESRSLTERLTADAASERTVNAKALLIAAALILIVIVVIVIASR